MWMDWMQTAMIGSRSSTFSHFSIGESVVWLPVLFWKVFPRCVCVWRVFSALPVFTCSSRPRVNIVCGSTLSCAGFSSRVTAVCNLCFFFDTFELLPWFKCSFCYPHFPSSDLLYFQQFVSFFQHVFFLNFSFWFFCLQFETLSESYFWFQFFIRDILKGWIQCQVPLLSVS